MLRPDRRSCGTLAVGPRDVRRFCCAPTVAGRAPVTVRSAAVVADARRRAERIAAALDWIDEPIALLDQTPIPIGELWRDVLRDVACATARRNGVITVIHPSWWAPTRVDTVVAAARETVGKVRTQTRAETLAGPDAGVGVIEIGDHLIAVSGGGGIVAEPRTGDPERVVQAVVQRAVALQAVSSFLVDGPDGVGGATALAGAIVQRLRALGARAEPATVAPARRRKRPHFTATRRQSLTVAAAVIAGALLTAVHPSLTGWRHPRALTVTSADPETVLVEGRVALRVPDGWQARRITDGPGSARVQIVSPSDPTVALHLTQSLLPWAMRDEEADALRGAFERAGGAFVDFNPDDLVAGRPAITYREKRPDRVVDWVVLLDGVPGRPVRIAIGCQARQPEKIRAACETAVRSARAVS